MKTTFTFALVLISIGAFSQVRFNHAGLGFNYNGTGNANLGGFEHEFFGGIVPNNNGGSTLNRTFSAYEFGLSSTSNPWLYFDFDLLQGTEYVYAYEYDNSTRSDTSYWYSYNFDSRGSVVGLKGMARVTTPTDRRFFYNFGVGAEGLLTYGIQNSGSAYIDIWHDPSGYFHSESVNFRETTDSSYISANIVQQVGMAFRLAKDESNFPLNQTYVETNFQILNNFLFANDQVNKFRSYGLTLSLVYEIR